MAEPIQKQMGDYEIIRELGHGGMGQVYLVKNLLSDRVEAMKVLLPDLAQQGDLANRFMREIRVLASLEHPNIAALRTAFTANNQLVMIMEYVEGDTLAHRLERGPFSTSDALNYIGQVLAALSYAHSKNIIHRDIKPANMMLTPQGVVKLMDFGIARSSADLGLTVTGTTLGSLDYMSPEQVKSEPTDARSDLYSVGVSLYEMLTGHRMFSATSSYSVMEAHVKETPRPPIEIQPHMPKPLSDMIMMAVAKDPSQRFQTADAFRNALSQIKDSVPAAAQQPPLTRTVTTPSAAAMAAMAPATPVPATPRVDPGAYATPQSQPVAARGGRHVGWLLAFAIVVLIAIFGGTQAYRAHQQNAATSNAIDSAMKAATPAQPETAAPAQPQPTPPAATPDSATAQGAAPSGGGAPAHRSRASEPPPDQGAANAQAAADAQAAAEAAAEQKKLFDGLETEIDQLDSRAAAIESSVGALEQQMQQSGLGLRGDMVAARANMRNDLAKAKDAMNAADAERARKYVDQANHEIQKLEGFLGRR